MKHLLSALAITLLLSSCKDSATAPETDPDPAPSTYVVSVSVEPADAGSISPAADSTYEEGEKIQLSATPAEGYRFAGWSGDAEGADNPLSLTIDKDYTLSASFELKNYELAVSKDGEGTVTETVIEQKSADYAHGTRVELTASPATGWAFTGWQGAVSGADNPAQVTVDGPKEITASFGQLTFYRAANGVTIMCPDVAVGATGLVDGTEYTKRSKAEITEANAATTCTSGITDMEAMFLLARNFNADISHWDVSAVTTMREMFRDAGAFNQDIGAWDVGNVTSMRMMFAGADAFNADIGAWDMSSVTNVMQMFSSAESFNQDLSGWDVSGVTSMEQMFLGASVFNGDLSGWDVSNVNSMSNMFYGASAFNRDIGAWDVSSVTTMGSMFNGAASFNQDLSGWCVSQIASEPAAFDTGAGFENNTALQPQWGTCP